MKKVLIDSKSTVVYTGQDSKEVLRCLEADIYSLSEEDEVKYKNAYSKLLNEKGECVHGQLTYQVHIDIKFKGIDDWNRPVFRDIDTNLYFGDVNKLWVWDEAKNGNVEKYYKENIGALEYFGCRFNCEPHGGLPSFYKLNIVNTEN